MKSFIEKHKENIIGVLSGFDRLVLRGTLRSLSVACGMMDFLYRMRILLKDFKHYAEQTTQRLKQASLSEANRLNRPVVYLSSSKESKDAKARKIMESANIKEGLICVLTCVEPCMSYEIYRDKKRKELRLEPRIRKCLHLYHYLIDPEFGFMNARIQTWFPFTIQVCLNGREWLSRQLDRHGNNYLKSDNCFPRIDNAEKAQKLMDKQLELQWPQAMERIAFMLNPAFDEIFRNYYLQYYWTVHQSEWATDIMFKSPAALASVFPQLARGSISSFCSHDVMRFLGDKKLNGNFMGELVSNYKKRVEGIRVKHRVKSNSVKMYDKQGSILRIETTINDPTDFKVFRPKQGEPNGEKDWRKMRRSIADLHRRAKVSQGSNNRYLDALSGLDTDCNLCDLVMPVCSPVEWKNKRVRALRPWSVEDENLLLAVSHGEFCVNGFRNRDLRDILEPNPFQSLEDKKRAVSRVTRKIRLLRAHGMIKKVSHTHRYVLTKKGNEVIKAIIGYQQCTLAQLARVAA